MGRVARKLALSLGVLLAAVLAAEGAARAWFLAQGRPYSNAKATEDVREALSLMTDLLPGAPEPRDGPLEREDKEILYALHPYTGFDTQAGLRAVEGCVRYFEEGENADKYTVFVCGGSVAAIFAGWSRGAMERVREKLPEHPALGGRSVRSFRFAVPGFKQPQQLMQLAYLLSRGCRPDMVVNLDGFNELNASVNNAVRGLQPTWPSFGHWAELAAGDRPDQVAMRLLLDVIDAQERARRVAGHALEWRYPASALLGRMTQGRLERLRGEWTRAQERYLDHLAETRKDRRDMPLGVEAEKDGALEEAIRCWYESSLAMHHLCEARGILYLHAIQPTLHDEGAKVLTEDERRKGIGDRGPNQRILDGYPVLREKCAELRALGVDAVDATMVFAEEKGTIYYDNCHFGKRGNRILADFLLSEMERMLDRQTAEDGR